MHGFGRMVCSYHGLLGRDVLSAVLYWVYEVSQGVSLVNKMQHNWEHVPTYRSMVCIKLRIWLKITFFCLATTDPTTGLIVHKSLNNEGKYWTFMQCVILNFPTILSLNLSSIFSDLSTTPPNFREWNQGRVAGIKACLQEKTKNHLMFVTDVAWSVSDIDGRIPPYLRK